MAKSTLVSIVSCLSAVSATAGEMPLSVVKRLAESERIICQPVSDYFCENIHVGCSGRSTILAVPFAITNNDNQVVIQSDPRHSSAQAPIRRGSIIWAEDGRHAVVRVHSKRDYIKISSDGSFSFRYYYRGKALMTYGKCN